MQQLSETFTDRLKVVQSELEARLERLLPKAGRVEEAMRYSAFGRAKRVRPALCVWACAACGGDPEQALSAAAALEMIHVYSLIHDDLPAMDDDDMRRGRPSCHKAFDEATAILAGDALLTEAFLVLAREYADKPALSRALIERIAEAAGSRGMVGGQMIDMESMALDPVPSGDEALALLERLHAKKTGALLRASVISGALVAGAKPELIERLERYGQAIGLAFQVTDDILDATMSSEALGKTSGKDEAQGKLTYPSLMGLDGARHKAQELEAQALDAIAPLGTKAEALRDLARYIVARQQ